VTLFNLTFPDNALFLFKLISQISRFNLIPIDHIVNAWFRFTPHNAGEEVINENFGIMGYESWNLMQTLDTVILFIIGIVVSIVLTFLIDLLVPIPLR
jgi:hypothetical protein